MSTFTRYLSSIVIGTQAGRRWIMEKRKLEDGNLEEVSGGKLNPDGTSSFEEPECPNCRSLNVVPATNFYPITYLCKDCGEYFEPKRPHGQVL